MLFNLVYKSLLIFILTCSFCLFAEDSASSKQEKVSVNVSTKMILWYQKHIGSVQMRECSFYPSCSEYTKVAMQKHGFFQGWFMGCDRLMRCNHDLWVYEEVKVEGVLKKYDPVL